MFARWIFILILIFSSNANAEIKTYSGIGEYIMSEFETLDVAKQRAKQKAERDAQEQAGVYVNSYTKVKNSQVTEDEIITMTNGILSVTDCQFNLIPLSDGKSINIRAAIKANIDTEDINKWLEKGVQERSELANQNKELQNENIKQEKMIDDLKQELANVKTQRDRERITREFAAADKIFLSNRKFEEAGKFYEKDDFENVIKFCTQAIELNPNNANAYGGRGIANTHFKNFRNAIVDFSRALQIDPNITWAYSGRAMAYYFLHDYVNAIEDFNLSIKLFPRAAILYRLRGMCHQRLGNHSQAEIDFEIAKKLGYV